MTIRERVLRFGQTGALVGILSEPLPGTTTNARPGVLLLNAGLLHRVGPCRLYVNIARRLAASGYAVLRFDLSGIGDSEKRRDKMPFSEAAGREIIEAMDQLGDMAGTDRFVLMGLSRGANQSLALGVTDPRVAGMVCLDPWAYRTAGFWLRYYASRVRKLSTWKNFVAVRLKRLISRSRRPEQEIMPHPLSSFPRQEDVAEMLETLVQRGVQLYYVFSGGRENLYNYTRQFEDAFHKIDFGDKLRAEYLPGSSHIFGDLFHQRYLVNTIDDWMCGLWGRAADNTTDTAGVPEQSRDLETGRLTALEESSVTHAASMRHP